MSPIACDVDAEGRVVVSTRETAMKVKHIARDPHVAICVLNDGFFGEWVQVEGTAEVVHLPEAMDGLVEYYRRVSGEHPDWDDYRAAMERERRVLVRITGDVAAGPTAGLGTRFPPMRIGMTSTGPRRSTTSSRARCSCSTCARRAGSPAPRSGATRRRAARARCSSTASR